MKSLAALVLLATAIVTPACAPAPAPAQKVTAPDTTAADLKAIRAAGALGFEALQAGDAASVAAFYSEDAVLMPANSPYVVGRMAIREQYAREFVANKAAGITLDLDENDIGVSGTLGWRSGTFLGTGPVKGFAVTLIIGVLMTLFTAVVVTRAMFEILISSGATSINLGQKKSA